MRSNEPTRRPPLPTTPTCEAASRWPAGPPAAALQRPAPQPTALAATAPRLAPLDTPRCARPPRCSNPGDAKASQQRFREITEAYQVGCSQSVQCEGRAARRWPPWAWPQCSWAGRQGRALPPGCSAAAGAAVCCLARHEANPLAPPHHASHLPPITPSGLPNCRCSETRASGSSMISCGGRGSLRQRTLTPGWTLQVGPAGHAELLLAAASGRPRRAASIQPRRGCQPGS